MFDQLVSLFSGWYLSFVDSVKSVLTIQNTVGEDLVMSVPEVWSAFVPWEHLIAAVVLVTFIIALCKLLRCVICQIL